MKYGDRIIIDRKTGEVLQLERMTEESFERGIRIIAKALVDGLIREMESQKGSTSCPTKR